MLNSTLKPTIINRETFLSNVWGVKLYFDLTKGRKMALTVCCLDLKTTNKVTLFDVEPMPQPEGIFIKRYILLKTGFCKGYHQIKMAARDKEKPGIYYKRRKFRFMWLIRLLDTRG